MPTKILPFVTRADLLKIRDMRKWGRFLSHLGHYRNPDPAERVRLQHDQVQEAARDVEWSRRHGPIAGGAMIVQFSVPERPFELVARPPDPTAARRAHDEKYGGIVRRSRERETARREAESAQAPGADVSHEQKLPVPRAKHFNDPA
jgi:hypothetical protein